MKKIEEVSVPYRGILFFNRNKKMIKLEELFPSPIGESYFSMNGGTSIRIAQAVFPSPIGESYFSILANTFSISKADNSFRPLSGNLIFQYPLPHLPVPQGCQGTLRGKEIFHGILSIYSCSISAKALIYGLRRKTSFFPVFCRYIIPSEQFFHDNVYTSIYVEIHHI